MILVQISGGLGNQLFQYATARALALHKRAPLKFDLSILDKDRIRSYRLKHFKVQGEVATALEIKRFDRTGAHCVRKPFYEHLQSLLPYHRRSTLSEQRVFVYDPKVFKCRRQVHLIGYWQNEKYFRHIRQILLDELDLKTELCEADLDVAQQIRVTEAVSLHVRRTDYVTNPRTHRIHGTCGTDYYTQAIAWVCQNTSAPTFFVFSDDIEWAKANLQIEQAHRYIDHNGAQADFRDLWLLRQCRHHIIANSTFSWWGAWLGEHPAKMVVAPRRWFRCSKDDARDLIPSTWKTL